MTQFVDVTGWNSLLSNKHFPCFFYFRSRRNNGDDYYEGIL